MTARFDPRAAWDALDDDTRRAIGEAALLLQLATEAQQLVIDDPPSLQLRRWETGEQVAWRLLEAAVPIDADLYPEGPDLAVLGVRACRVCGCTDEFGCPEDCEWIGPDLCSACRERADG